MSSHDDVDVDIDVVSSPEPSPRGGANTTDDESPSYSKRLKLSPPPAVSIAASLLTTTANLSPSTLQNLQNHSAQLLSNQYHSQLSNSLLTCSNNKENHISASECGRLSPPRTPETNNNLSLHTKLSPSTTTPHSGFTSFSISSILSRQDSPNSKKLIAPIPAFPINVNGSQDAAMISRWECRRRNLISTRWCLSGFWIFNGVVSNITKGKFKWHYFRRISSLRKSLNKLA